MTAAHSWRSARPAFVALIALAAAGPAARVVRAQMTVPLDASGEWLIVPVVVEGRDTLRFILDTGAMRSVLSRRTAVRLRLPQGRSVTVQGASGSAAAPLVTLRTFEFAGRTVRDMNVLVLSDEILTPATGPSHRSLPFDGVLGADVLAAYDVLISVPAGEVVLFEPGSGTRLARADLGAPLRSTGRGAFVAHDIEIDGTAVAAILDSGARHIVLNERAGRLPGLRMSGDSARRASPGVGSDTSTIRSAVLNRLAIGTTTFFELPAQLADLPVFTTLGLNDRPAALLGVPALRSCAVLIAYQERTVRYCRQPAGPPR